MNHFMGRKRTHISRLFFGAMLSVSLIASASATELKGKPEVFTVSTGPSGYQNFTFANAKQITSGLCNAKFGNGWTSVVNGWHPTLPSGDTAVIYFCTK